MKTPISIIIPCYGASSFIHECLDSIYSNDLNNREFEVILGIDGCKSSLSTILSLTSYYKNIKVFYSKENNGTYITINSMLQYAKYDYILKFDADDVMKPDLINLLDRYANTQCDYCILRGQDFTESIEDVNPKIWYYGGLWFSSQKTFKVLGGFQPWLCAADSELIDRAKRSKQLKVTSTSPNEGVFYRRVHPGSITKQGKTSFSSDLRKQYREQIGKSEIFITPTVAKNFEKII